ncbi:7240_t:CDS:2, partial [Cetraspora pellucida]
MSSSNNFTSTHEFNTSNDSNNITEDNVQRYINKSRIKNTDACTQKWVRSLQEYRNKKNISYDIQILNDKNQLEQELSSAIKNININDRFQFPILYRIVDGKIIELQDQGLGKIDQSKGLTAEEICQILLYLESGKQTALKLTWKAFFWNAYLLGLRGGDHYQLLLSCFNFQQDGSLIFIIGREKNNQGGLKGQNKYGRFTSRQIHIPADQLNN